MAEENKATTWLESLSTTQRQAAEKKLALAREGVSKSLHHEGDGFTVKLDPREGLEAEALAEAIVLQIKAEGWRGDTKLAGDVAEDWIEAKEAANKILKIRILGGGIIVDREDFGEKS